MIFKSKSVCITVLWRTMFCTCHVALGCKMLYFDKYNVLPYFLSCVVLLVLVWTVYEKDLSGLLLSILQSMVVDVFDLCTPADDFNISHFSSTSM